MTVKELVEKLKEFDENLPVYVNDNMGGGYPVSYMWPKETTCNSCDKDFLTIYEGGLTAVEFVFCPCCGEEAITHI